MSKVQSIFLDFPGTADIFTLSPTPKGHIHCSHPVIITSWHVDVSVAFNLVTLFYGHYFHDGLLPSHTLQCPPPQHPSCTPLLPHSFIQYLPVTVCSQYDTEVRQSVKQTQRHFWV